MSGEERRHGENASKEDISMRATLIKIFSVLLGVGLLAMAGEAAACTTGCAPPAPPTRPHNPTPPHMPCTSCGGGSSASAHASASASANVNVNVNASGSASGAYYGGGYGNWSQTPGYPQEVGGLNVVGGDCCSGRMESYSEQQTLTKRTVIEANCIDDTGVPHPASQVFPDRDISSDYRGEVYRCIAGTHMQWIVADYNGQISFDNGQTNTCKKDEALWHENGQLSCRPQIPQRQCNERSLLRRFGAGVKILTLTRTETITKQRQVACNQCQSKAVMTFDGGVGGFVQ
jgi:hypothetical protein